MRGICRLLAILLAGVLLGGCDVLGPVVGIRDGGVPTRVCANDTVCERPDPPPRPLPTRDRLTLPDPGCAELPVRVVHVGESGALELDDATCLEVHVDGPPDAQPIALSIRGEVLRALHLSVIAERRTVLDVDAGLEGAVLTVTGEVEVAIHGALVSSIVRLQRAPSGTVPTLVARDAAWFQVELHGPEAHVRMRDIELESANVTVRDLTLERGLLADVVLVSSDLDLLEVDLVSVHLDVRHLASVQGRWDRSTLIGCERAWLSGLTVVGGDLASCTDRLELRDGLAEDTVFRGALHATDLEVRRSTLAGDLFASDVDIQFSILRGTHVIDPGGLLDSVALCGTEDLTAGVLACPNCAPSAPSEVCVEGPLSLAARCPGLCRSSCRGEANACE
jgi:hypothetical protein